MDSTCFQLGLTCPIVKQARQSAVGRVHPTRVGLTCSSVNRLDRMQYREYSTSFHRRFLFLKEMQVAQTKHTSESVGQIVFRPTRDMSTFYSGPLAMAVFDMSISTFTLSFFGGLLLCVVAAYITPWQHLLKTELHDGKAKPSHVPVSVNYFPTRLCNKACGFCFHVGKTSYMLSEKDAKRGLKKLVEAGMKKLNVAGGEPFLFPEFLGNICRYVKEDLCLESVSIITNGSKVTEEWLQKYGKFIDILAVSCDSINEQTNIEIGRGSGDNMKQLRQISKWCQHYGIKFKMNTVVCKLNWQQDMSSIIEELNPFRWKCFQVLLVGGENDAKSARGRGKQFDKFRITGEEFEAFCERHRHLGDRFIPESNAVMAKSYLLLDEYMRFLDKGNGVEKTSESILDVSVAEALSQVEWDVESFEKRGGIYDWRKEVPQSGGDCGSVEMRELDW